MPRKSPSLLSPSSPPVGGDGRGHDFDLAGFQRLLEKAGPATATDLLARLQSDLTAVSQALDAAFATRDWASLGRQSHILIGLTGILGAGRLLECAQTLNAATHAKDWPGADATQTPLMAQLAGLIHVVSHFPQPTARTP